jgi:predicted metal-dependent phosphoesterase TrpH
MSLTSMRNAIENSRIKEHPMRGTTDALHERREEMLRRHREREERKYGNPEKNYPLKKD